MESCLLAFEGLLDARCPACARPVGAAPAPLVACPVCAPGAGAAGRPFHLEGFAPGLSCGVYRGAWRQLVLQAKQGPGRPAFVPLRRVLLQAVLASGLPRGGLLAPPPSRMRRWRGWHLADELADALAARLGWPRLRPLRRRRERPPQAGLGAATRRVNLVGSFAPRGAARRRRGEALAARVYIVDDVHTTGATLQECRRVLLAQGVREVRPLVLARVPEPSVRSRAPVLAGPA